MNEGDVEDLILVEIQREIEAAEAVLMENLNVVRVQGRVQEVLPVNINFWRELGDPTFKRHFRMTRLVFESLIIAVGNHLVDKGRLHFLRTPLDVSLLMVLWIMAKPDSFLSTANHFGTTPGIVHFHYKYVIQALRELSSKYIKWPGPIARENIKSRFEDRYGYVGVVGCIDCTNIRIHAPHIHPRRYVNRHDDHAIMVQAVCDDRMIYTDVYVGEPGSVGDRRCFERSPLSHNLFTRGGLLAEGEHLLGDGAYPLSTLLMIPFVNDGHLTNRQKAHNLLLSRTRATVERSFALLKGRWRRLQFLPSFNLKYAIDHIMASIVLHNFVELGGQYPGLPGDDDPPHRNVPHVDIHQVLQQAQGDGAVKRELIAESLYPPDN